MVRTVRISFFIADYVCFKVFREKKFPDSNNRPGHKGKKRYFHGNRYSSEFETEFANTSAKKLKESNNSDMQVDMLQNYCFINFLSIFAKLTEILVCKDCKKEVLVRLEMGLGF